jgi:hypothetical protein
MTTEPRANLTTRWVAGLIVLVLADAAQLLSFYPGRTDELWAWPIQPELTSMVLASAYIGGGYFFARVLFGAPWRRVAAGFPPVVLFVWMAAIATFLHLDRFTTDSLPFAAWIALYVLTPVGVPLLYRSNRDRMPAERGPRLPLGVRRALAVAGGAIVAGGLVMLADPQPFIDAWPWTLTPLTARIVAAVLALFGSVWVSVAVDGTRAGARIPLEGHAIGLAALLLALARGHGDVDWGDPAAPLLAAVAAAMGLVSLVLSRAQPAQRR